MPQQIVYTDEREDSIVKDFAKIWDLSKADTIKKIIREFTGKEVNKMPEQILEEDEKTDEENIEDENPIEEEEEE